MTVMVNGQPCDLPDGATLADVLHWIGAPSRGVAVALDGAVVPRARWAGTRNGVSRINSRGIGLASSPGPGCSDPACDGPCSSGGITSVPSC